MRDCDAAAVEDAHRRADRVAVRLRADETEPQAAVAGGLIVAKEHRRAVVGRHQQVDVAVAIEVAAREPAADPRLREAGAGRRRHVAKRAVALIQEQVRRLRVADVAADVPHGLVDVAVGDDEIERAVEIEIGEDAAEPERVRATAAPTPARDRDVLDRARGPAAGTGRSSRCRSS